MATTGDLLEEFEEYQRERKGSTYASLVREDIPRRINAVNEGLKIYVEESPYASTVHSDDIKEIMKEEEEFYHVKQLNLEIFSELLDFSGYEDVLDDEITGDGLKMDREKIDEETTPFDHLIPRIGTKLPREEEKELAEYTLAELSREEERPYSKSKVKDRLEERLGYELTASQIESRLDSSGIIESTAPGGGNETHYFISQR